MTKVHIGTEHNGLLLAIIESSEPSPYMRARLNSGALSAESKIYRNYASGFHDLASFFSSLELDWRGWGGLRTWASVEDDLHFRAHHDGHVQLHVELREPPWATAAWSATARLTIDPGEQLSRIAAATQTLAKGADGKC